MRLNYFFFLFSSFCFMLPVRIYADGGEQKKAPTGDSTKIVAKAQPGMDRKQISFTGFPVVLYMPETSVIFGGGAAITIRDKNSNLNERPDVVNFRAIYTLKNQIAVNLAPELYFKDYKWNIRPLLAYQRFPDSFYGLGNRNSGDDAEDYTTEDFLFYMRVTRQTYKALRLGLRYGLKKTNVLRIEENGLLAEGKLQGINGSFISGFGPVLEWDNRDNIFYPSKGFWVQCYASYYRSWMGSRFDFDYYTIDFRYYLSLSKSHILAIQLLGSSSSGEIPFNEYTRLESMRGINGSRFRDNKMFLGQIEYRYPVYKRFSGVVFVAAGDVVDEIRNYEISNMKLSFGLGLRYLVNPEEKINFRLDIGFGPGGVNPYFQITEAF